MRRNAIALIWLAGAAFALILWLAGPDHFIDRLGNTLAALGSWVDSVFVLMSAASFDALRAATLALFAVFVLLALNAASRGLRARWALFAVSTLFLMLVAGGPAGSAPRWLTAFILAAAGAGSMTLRLLRRVPRTITASKTP